MMCTPNVGSKVMVSDPAHSYYGGGGGKIRLVTIATLSGNMRLPCKNFDPDQVQVDTCMIHFTRAA